MQQQIKRDQVDLAQECQNILIWEKLINLKHHINRSNEKIISVICNKSFKKIQYPVQIF